MKLAASLNPHDLKSVLERMQGVEKKQMPFAMSLALNKTGEHVLGETERLMEREFKSPTRWTLNAFRLKRSSKHDLEAAVERKTSVAKRHYLETEAEGGIRPHTGIEGLIAGQVKEAQGFDYVVPARDARLNKHGNLPMSQVRKAVDGVKHGGGGKSARYFATGRHGKLSPGIYQQRGKRLRKLLAFTNDAPSYTARFPMVKHGLAAAGRVIPGHIKDSIRFALKTAKK